MSMELTELIYALSQAFPAEEQFGLKSQLRRAAVSIPANIAEGKGRHHDKVYVQFLYNARGSLYELMTLLALSRKLRYLNQESCQQARELSERVLSKLSGLINSMA